MNLPVTTVLIVSVVIAAALVYAPFLVVGYARVTVGYDIASPRAMFDQLPAYGQRATWAHQNSFEAFMLFAAAGLMGVVTGVDAPLAAQVAIVHLVARLFYSVFYILNVPLARSLMFGIGSAGTATLFLLSVLKVWPT